MAGNFLKDGNGELVVANGSPIISKTLTKHRKPNACNGCEFSRWCVGDTCFVIQNPGGGMEWLCPNCALDKGLPPEYYMQNKYSKPPSTFLMQSEKATSPPCSQMGWQSMTKDLFSMFST